LIYMKNICFFVWHISAMMTSQITNKRWHCYILNLIFCSKRL